MAAVQVKRRNTPIYGLDIDRTEKGKLYVRQGCNTNMMLEFFPDAAKVMRFNYTRNLVRRCEHQNPPEESYYNGSACRHCNHYDGDSKSAPLPLEVREWMESL